MADPTSKQRLTKAERKEEARRQRVELQRKMNRRNRRIAMGVVVALVVGVGAYALTRPQRRARILSCSPPPIRGGRQQGAAGRGRGHVRAEEPGPEHIVAQLPLSSYPSVPPASGPHSEITYSAGVYSTPPPIDRVLHSLEHGAAVVWYSSVTGPELRRIRSFYGEDDGGPRDRGAVRLPGPGCRGVAPRWSPDGPGRVAPRPDVRSREPRRGVRVHLDLRRATVRGAAIPGQRARGRRLLTPTPMAKKRRRPSESPTAADRPSHRCAGSGSQDGPRRVGTPRTPRRGPGNRASALCSRRTQGDGPTRTRAGAEGDRASERHPPRADDRRRGHRALRRRLPGLLQREIGGRRIGPGTRGRRRGRMRRHRDAGRRGAGRHPPRIGRVRRIHGAPGDLGASRPRRFPPNPRCTPSRSGRRTPSTTSSTGT